MRSITMTLTLAASLAALFSTAACGKDGDKASGGGGGAEKVAGGGAAASAAVDYSAIDKMVDAAKTGDDFTNVLLACGKLEMSAATDGKELAKDKDYQEHCRWRATSTRAQLAISESTPDKMSSHCLAASMGLDEVAKDGIHADEARALKPKVDTACGL